MTIGTLFTLFVVPTAYLLIAPDFAKAKSPAPAGIPLAQLDPVGK
jgi:hypothetical protein